MKDLVSKFLHQFSCKHYTELASRAIEEPLSWKEKPGFWLHHVICTVCRRFRRQITMIDEATMHLECDEELQTTLSSGDERLSPERKEQILSAISSR